MPSRGYFRSATAECQYTSYPHGGPDDGDVIAALVAKGAMNGVHFRTEDLNATLIRIDQPPAAQS